MTHALVILCGGPSTRMGSDKALLPFGDNCLIEYLVHKFRPCFSRIYLSVRRKGNYAYLNLPVTEIPDIYPNAGPMSGVFSCLSMIDEDKAFFLSVDMPFLEPETGISLLREIGSSDICMIQEKSGNLHTSAAAYSKSCITAIGKCLLLRQITIQSLREKCRTRYLTEKSLATASAVPIEIQLFNIDTRKDYYRALHLLSSCAIEKCACAKSSTDSFSDQHYKPFSQPAPVLSFVSKPGTKITPFLENLAVSLKREGLNILLISIEDKNMVIHNMNFPPVPETLSTVCEKSDLIFVECDNMDLCPINSGKIEILKKGWSEIPLLSATDGLLAILTDFSGSFRPDVPVFDVKHPRDFLRFIHRLIAEGF